MKTFLLKAIVNQTIRSYCVYGFEFHSPTKLNGKKVKQGRLKMTPRLTSLLIITLIDNSPD